MAEATEDNKTTDFYFASCRTHSPRMACATNSCTRGINQCTQCVGWRRRDRGGKKALLNDFWYFWSCKSTISTKNFQVSFKKRHLIRQPTAATFCPCLGDADRVRFANRSIPHWRRLVVTPVRAQTSPHPHPKFNREVRHSLTWHSSKSESAL